MMAFNLSEEQQAPPLGPSTHLPPEVEQKFRRWLAEHKKTTAEEETEKRADEAAPQELVMVGFPTRIAAAPATSSTASASLLPGDRFWNNDLRGIWFTIANLANSFQHIDDLPKRKITYGFTWACYDRLCKGWNLADGPLTAQYSSQHDLQHLVYNVCREICGVYRFPYRVMENAKIPRGKLDVSLWKGSVPYIAVQVKKPDGAFTMISSYQQMSKDLTCLRLEFGVPAPIGILTTYEGWQFCWHEYATPVATARTIAEFRRFHCEVGQDDFNTLCVSPAYSVEDPNLRLLIASLFYKMEWLTSFIPPSRSMRYSREQFQTTFPGLDSGKVDVSKTAPFLSGESAKSDALYCVKTLGVGAEGETCLMADEDGACCAVKFYQFDTSEWDWEPTKAECDAMCAKMCAEEHAAWVRAYGEDCGVRVAVLDKRDVLVMPPFQPISLADWEDPGTMDIAMKHIMELFRNKGVCHTDIEPRHVMWRDMSVQSAVLVGWGGSAADRGFSEKEYHDYAKEKLQLGINAMKEEALARAQRREAAINAAVQQAQLRVAVAEAWLAAAVAEQAVAEAEAAKAAAGEAQELLHWQVGA